MQISQQKARRIFYIAVLLAGLGWIWLSAAPANATTAGKIPAPQAGFLAPDFSLTTLDGQTLTLSDLRGQVVLVNIWATWCPPCRAEMPAIEATYRAYKDQGFVVLAVNSTSQDQQANIQPFMDEYGLTFPVPLDLDGTTTRAYRISSLPSSFFIGRDGVIRDVVIGGPMAEALLRSRIQKLLEEKP
jgi:peroxiredoxin